MNKEFAEALVPVIKLLFNEHVDTESSYWESSIYGFHGDFGISLWNKNKSAKDLGNQLFWKNVNTKLKMVNVNLYAGIVNDAYVVRMRTVNANPSCVQLDIFHEDGSKTQKPNQKLNPWILLKNKILRILNKISLLRQAGFFSLHILHFCYYYFIIR